MEKYENLGTVGEGSYGVVLKCRNRDTGQLVAIKKFLESEDDTQVKKIAVREVKMLKLLRHDNLVNLLEVFRRKKRLYLVFEYVDRTLLDDLEANEVYGLSTSTVRQYLWQIISAVQFCHSRNVIHRDVKPENILVSKEGILKLCDFGFARIVASAAAGEVHTDYVATRWYRAPELLVGDTTYGKSVDVWAIGCLLAEMLTAEPLFPGDSDIDQLHHIVKCLGNLTRTHTEVFLHNSLFIGIRLPQVATPVTLQKKLPTIAPKAMDLLHGCLRLDPAERDSCEQLLQHSFFTDDNFSALFPNELKAKIRKADRRAAGGKDRDRDRKRRSPKKDATGADGRNGSKTPLKDSLKDSPPQSDDKSGASLYKSDEKAGVMAMPVLSSLTLPHIATSGASAAATHSGGDSSLPPLGATSTSTTSPGKQTFGQSLKSMGTFPQMGASSPALSRPPLGGKKPQYHLPKGSLPHYHHSHHPK